MRILPDDTCLKWPELVSQICFARDSAPHSALGDASPFEIHHGVPARNPFAPATPLANPDAPMPQFHLDDPAACAEAAKTSAAAFTSMANAHSDFERRTTADRLNETGRPRTYTKLVSGLRCMFPQHTSKCLPLDGGLNTCLRGVVHARNRNPSPF